MNLAERRRNRLLVERIDVLRTAFRSGRARHPFHLETAVILPDHLHCVWTLAPGDTDVSTRWSLIRGHFSRAIEKGKRILQSGAKRVNEVYGSAVCADISSVTKRLRPSRGLCPLEPGKTRWVRRVADRPHSSFPCVQAARIYPGLGW